MRAEFQELWKYRELLFAMVERELRIRYKNSVLGFLWSLLNPLITVAVMTIVFKYLMGNTTPNFAAYVLAAYLPYMFFQLGILDCAQSVLGALPVVRKVYFPREILPLASIIANFVHLALAILVYFVFLLAVWLRHPGDCPYTWNVLWLPALLVIQFCMVAGFGFIVSALNTFYEDVKYMVGVLLWVLFFLCPIMYFSENVYYQRSPQIYQLYRFNPIGTLIDTYRKVMVKPGEVEVRVGTNVTKMAAFEFQPLTILWLALFSFAVLVLGYHVFNRMKWRFVERP